MSNFFDKVQANCNFASIEMVRDVYYALMRTILDELRKHGSIKFDDWGEFKVKRLKARKIQNINTKQKEIVPAMNIVKFEPCKKLKFYIKNKL